MSEATDRRRVVVAGGGVAALEAVLALEKLGGPRLCVELLAPSGDFSFRPLLVAEPFGAAPAPRVPLRKLLAGTTVRHVAGALASVEPGERRVRTTAGELRDYDALLVACGAHAAPAVPGSLTFDGRDGVQSYRRLLADLRRNRVRRLVFALASESAWALPLYELALLTAAYLAARGIRHVALQVVTHERAPLVAFGAEGSAYLAELLEHSRVDVRTGADPQVFADGLLRLANGGSMRADRVVSLPSPVGPHIAGLPSDVAGFVPVDEYGRVAGVGDVYAAGDATARPVKQGGLAAQQADVAAAAIAAWAGAPVEPEPYRPVLRGLMLTGGRPVFLRGEDVGSEKEKSAAGHGALWWPSGKIAGRYLTSCLEEHGAIGPPAGVRKLVAIIARGRGPARAGA